MTLMYVVLGNIMYKLKISPLVKFFIVQNCYKIFISRPNPKNPKISGGKILFIIIKKKETANFGRLLKHQREDFDLFRRINYKRGDENSGPRFFPRLFLDRRYTSFEISSLFLGNI